jgi:hypothetical protein
VGVAQQVVLLESAIAGITSAVCATACGSSSAAHAMVRYECESTGAAASQGRPFGVGIEAGSEAFTTHNFRLQGLRDMMGEHATMMCVGKSSTTLQRHAGSRGLPAPRFSRGGACSVQGHAWGLL